MDINNLNQLLKLNQQGIIPGPEETFKSFYERAQYCLSLKDEVGEMFDKRDFFLFALEKLPQLKLYDIAINWVPVCYSNHLLNIWQAGSVWIFQKDLSAPKGAFIQLKRSFSADRPSRWYGKEEFLLHELAHVGRLAYEEPKFEEFLAYRTSKFCLRRFLGPIINSSKQAAVFMMSLAAVVFFEFLCILMGSLELYRASLWLMLFPVLLVIIAFLKLLQRHFQFNRCIRQLKALTGSKELASAIVYRLTDAEIIDFGRMEVSEIWVYASQQTCLRWTVIRGAYLERGTG